MGHYVDSRIKQLGLKYVEAKVPFPFKVTTTDVVRGICDNPIRCPVAVAVKRADPKAIAVYVNRSVVWIEYADRMVRYLLPYSLRLQIDKYDSTSDLPAKQRRFSPGEYAFSAVCPSRTARAVSAARAKRGRKSRGSDNKTGERRPQSVIFGRKAL